MKSSDYQVLKIIQQHGYKSHFDTLYFGIYLWFRYPAAAVLEVDNNKIALQSANNTVTEAIQIIAYPHHIFVVVLFILKCMVNFNSLIKIIRAFIYCKISF